MKSTNNYWRLVRFAILLAVLYLLHKADLYSSVPERVAVPACFSGGNPSVLVTGAAGFIGMHTTISLYEHGFSVVGIDLFTDYYSVQLKQDRAKHIKQKTGINIMQLDIASTNQIARLCDLCRGFDYIVHLAAQPGVRFSVEYPEEAVDANISKFMSFLKTVVRSSPNQVRLIFASSSSVYGMNHKIPFAEEDKTDMPAAIYGATKKANELMVYAFYHLYDVSAIGLRFFTVYGPWGRPDMAVYTFAMKIAKQEQITINVDRDYNEFRRDFTFVDDITNGILSSIRYLNGTHEKVYEIFNLGTSDQHAVSDVIGALEVALDKKALTQKQIVGANGDIYATHASLDKSKRILNYSNNYFLTEGIRTFAEWFKIYHKITSSGEPAVMF
ncbi:UDP-glucuronate 4-epimerase 2 [Picochlorum sp. SENEW3]|nr:UDP-glucuronate 4-epimerase 2 [Picochlorum sp. SENEW3]WPT14943.1 UDP-glucuronate 4-epimerase 2 [Picochlorum sp. SENEW3]